MSAVGIGPWSTWVGVRHIAGWGFSGETSVRIETFREDKYPHLNSLPGDKLYMSNVENVVRGKV